MSKFKVGDRVRCTRCSGVPHGPQGGAVYTVSSLGESDDLGLAELPNQSPGWFSSRFVLLETKSGAKRTKEEMAIAKAESNLAALKERAALKAKQAADRKAKAERAKALRGLSAAGKRVVAMLQAGSADDFGCQRDNVIKLVAAITGDKPDAIERAVAH